MTHFLRHSFYSLTSEHKENNSLKYGIRLNGEHPVFQGHFPQMPVVPGVCQIQIIKEILEDATGTKTIMVSGDNIKFTGMILPDKHPDVMIDINYTQADAVLSVEAKLYHNELIFTKYKGKFKILN